MYISYNASYMNLVLKKNDILILIFLIISGPFKFIHVPM